MQSFQNLSLAWSYNRHNLFLNKTCTVYTRHITVFFQHVQHILGLYQAYDISKNIYQAYTMVMTNFLDIDEISVVYSKAVMYILGIYLLYLYIKYSYIVYLYLYIVYLWYIPTLLFFRIQVGSGGWCSKSGAGPAAPEQPIMVSVCLVLPNLQMG